MKEFIIFRKYLVTKLQLFLRKPFLFSLPNFMRFQLRDSWFLLVPFCLACWFQAHMRVQEGHGGLFYIKSYSSHSVHFGPFLSTLVLFSPIQSTLVLFSPVCPFLSYLVQFGPVRSIMSTLVLFNPFVLIRSTLFPFSPILHIWSTFFIWSNSVHSNLFGSFRSISIYFVPLHNEKRYV